MFLFVETSAYIEKKRADGINFETNVVYSLRVKFLRSVQKGFNFTTTQNSVICSFQVLAAFLRYD